MFESTDDIYKLIIETANEGIWVIDETNITTFVNQTMADMLGCTPENMLGRSMFEYMDEEGLNIAKRNVARRRQGIKESHEFKLIGYQGKVVWTQMSTSAFVKDGQYKGALAMVTDITEKRAREDQRKENYLNYISLFEDSPVPIWDEDFSEVKKFIDGLKSKGIINIREYFKAYPEELEACSKLLIVNNINKAVVELNEAESKEHVMNHFRELINSRSAEYAILQMEAIANNQTTCQFDAELSTFKGNTRYVNFKWSVVKGHEEDYKKVYLSTTDLTDRIIDENLKLQLSNREKAVLLKEIHHRVKNNLQIISSLLNLQSRTFDDERTKELYDMSLTRIQSMAMVHELLYRSDNFSRINYKKYLERLVHPLIEAMKNENTEITFELKVDEIELNINTSIPLGLLINEILTNSLKHGLKEQEKGKIYVSIEKNNEGKFHLKIGDDGIGFTPKNRFEDSDTLGLQLISSLIEQLGGEIKREEALKGTHYTISFEELPQNG